jgi:hypothetical protein
MYSSTLYHQFEKLQIDSQNMMQLVSGRFYISIKTIKKLHLFVSRLLYDIQM